MTPGWDIARPTRPESVGRVPVPEQLRAIARFVDEVTIGLARLAERVADLSDDEQAAVDTALAWTAHEDLFAWADDLEEGRAEWRLTR